MRVFLTGGTGALGRRVVPLLVAAGHTVTVLTRSPEKAVRVRALGAESADVSIFDEEALCRAIDGHDAVVNLATHIPDLVHMSLPHSWDENTRIRTDGSRTLVAAMTRSGVRHLVQESITMIYDDGGDEWVDEDTTLCPSALATPGVLAAELHARSLSGRAVVLRFGMFYGAGASHTCSQLRIARTGFAPFLGRSGAYQTYLHLDDAASAVVAALDAPAGTYNVTENEPGRVSEITRALAAAVHRRSLWRVPVPAWSIGASNRFLFHSLRVSNARFTAATPWRPAYPNASVGWLQVVAAADAP